MVEELLGTKLDLAGISSKIDRLDGTGVRRLRRLRTPDYHYGSIRLSKFIKKIIVFLHISLLYFFIRISSWKFVVL